MKILQTTCVLALTSQALGHGYIWSIEADNTVYPGWDIFVDSTLEPTPNRISYGGGQTGPVMNTDNTDIACANPLNRNPVPGTIAEVRAGSNITFHWSRWLYSHKGPITAWMAPYDGDIAQVNVNELEFIKFGEDTMDENGVWANIRMMDQTNDTWTATIPADMKPGNYVIRHEIIALHFALRVTPGFEAFPIGPQFYMTCFNFKITGSGSATPKGARFPGAYQADEPGFHYDINSTLTYPKVGPALYKSAYDVQLEPRERVVISPTGQGAQADAEYYQNQSTALAQQRKVTEYYDSIGG